MILYGVITGCKATFTANNTHIGEFHAPKSVGNPLNYAKTKRQFFDSINAFLEQTTEYDSIILDTEPDVMLKPNPKITIRVNTVLM